MLARYQLSAQGANFAWVKVVYTISTHWVAWRCSFNVEVMHRSHFEVVPAQIMILSTSSINTFRAAQE
jgi:hypothetical protein